jgi:hypothetical protein
LDCVAAQLDGITTRLTQTLSHKREPRQIGPSHEGPFFCFFILSSWPLEFPTTATQFIAI